MEVSLLNVQGLPPGCLVSVRSGTTRCQAPADPEKMRLFFPKGAREPFKVDLLAPLGSSQIQFQPGANAYPIHVPVNGAIGSLTLGVREIEKPNNLDLNAIASMEYTKDDKGRPATPATASRRHRLALAARTYLDDHQLLMFVQSLLQGLIRDRPIDPWEYINDASLTAKKVGVSAPYKPGMTPREEEEFAPPSRAPDSPVAPLEYHQKPSVGSWLMALPSRSAVEPPPESPKATLAQQVDVLKKKCWGNLLETANDGRLSVMLKDVIEGGLRRNAQNAMAKASQDGTLDEIAARIKAVEALRISAVSRLLQAAENGTLEQAAKQFAEEANAPELDMIGLQHQARAALLGASETGRLTEVLGEQQKSPAAKALLKKPLTPELEGLRKDMRNLLVKASQDGSFEQVLVDIRPTSKVSLPWYPLPWTEQRSPKAKEDPAIAALRLRAQKTLLKASADGSFATALEATKEELEKRAELQALQGVARNALFEAGQDGTLLQILQQVNADTMEEAAARRKRAQELLQMLSGDDPAFFAAVEEAADEAGLEFKLQPKGATAPSSPSHQYDIEDIRTKVGARLVEGCADFSLLDALEEASREVETEESKKAMGWDSEKPNIKSLQQAAACKCGHVFVSDSAFCHKCGSKRPEKDIMEGDEVIERKSSRRYTVTKIYGVDALLKPVDGEEGDMWKNVEAVDKVPKLNLAKAIEFKQEEMYAPVNEARRGDRVQRAGNPRARGSILQRTTTDVLLKMEDGSEAWMDVEDLEEVLDPATNVEVGQDVMTPQGHRGTAKSRTTTEILVLHSDGTEEWHEVEEVGVPRIEDAKKLYSAIDTNKDGQISTDELLTAMEKGIVMDVESAKSNAQDALLTALLGPPEDLDDAKVNARNALFSAFLSEEENGNRARETARDALIKALVSGSGEEVEAAKQGARQALSAALFADEEVQPASEKAREPKDEPPSESAKQSEATPEAEASAAPQSTASLAELEDKVKQRNERFKKENDALRRENARLKAMLEKKQGGDLGFRRTGPDAS